MWIVPTAFRYVRMYVDMFENTHNTLAKGGLGLARAIFEYQRLGYNVSLPLVDNQQYDLVIEKGGLFQSIQCKATSERAKDRRRNKVHDRYVVGLRSIKTNTKTTTIVKKGKFDLLFVFCANGDCYSIPWAELPEGAATLGVKYERYKIGNEANIGLSHRTANAGRVHPR